MIRVQQIIHSLEEGKWAGRIRGLVLLLLLGSLGLVYNLNLTQNFTSPEAMDAAQLARNIAEGRGYTTRFIRPLSVDILLQQGAISDENPRSHVPDITNPPLYPLLLAGWMKVLPFEFEIDIQKANEFKRYQPEFLIWLFNQALFFVALIQLFRLGEKLFDPPVAWSAVLLFLGTELYWKFSTSGLPVMLLVVLFLALAKTLVRLEEQGNDGIPQGGGWFVGMALWTGVLVGLGGLTRYGFVWVIMPVLVYLGLFLGRHRGRAVVLALLGFLLVMTPWLVRNVQLSGNLFGTAGLALYGETQDFPGDTLERMLKFYESSDVPENGQDENKVTVVDQVGLWDIGNKLKRNLRDLLVNELPRFSGGWFGVVCLVGLMMPFRSRSLRRLRVFLLMTLVLFAVGQALGRTHLSSPNGTLTELLARSLGQGGLVNPMSVVNGENLLAILGPVLFMFGVGLFFSMLDQWRVNLPEMRLAASACLVTTTSLPMALSFLLPHPTHVDDPLYHPAQLQYLRSVPVEHGSPEIKQDDLVMSDLPWAVAWYGNQDCVWLTRNVQPDFYVFNDRWPVSALYFTEITTDQRYTARMLNAPELNWERFMLAMQIEGDLPDGFPLKAVSNIFSRGKWLFFAAPEEQP